MERRCACRFRQVCRCFFYGFSFFRSKKNPIFIVTRSCHCRYTNVSRFKVIYVLLICNNNPNIIYYANKV